MFTAPFQALLHYWRRLTLAGTGDVSTPGSLEPSSSPLTRRTLRLGGSCVPVAPNARFQARRRAGARDERTLFAVACKPLLGCWRPTQVPGPPGDRLPRPPRAPPRRRMPPRPVGRGRPPGSPMPPVACLALLGHGADVLPCPPPAPAESPHAAPETPPLSWRRTRRHVTLPRPCPWWRCRDTSHRHAPWSQHGRASPPSHPAAGA
jgi:hypothetical protein